MNEIDFIGLSVGMAAVTIGVLAGFAIFAGAWLLVSEFIGRYTQAGGGWVEPGPNFRWRKVKFAVGAIREFGIW